MDASFKAHIEDSINYMEDHGSGPGAPGFTAFERSGFKRILSWFDRATPTEVLRVQRMDFVKYVDEYDRRKGTNFLKTFPEYKNFYNMCKKLC